MFTENGNRPRGWGMLDPAQFRQQGKDNFIYDVGVPPPVG